MIRNRGGLHNRLTHHLIVKPFTLHECEEYFKAYHFGYSRKQIAECYMVMGGIPYYLSMMDKSKSLAQNIDQLFFADNAELKDEFNDLYRALFKKSADHIAVVTALATKGMGMTRQELVKASGGTIQHYQQDDFRHSPKAKHLIPVSRFLYALLLPFHQAQQVSGFQFLVILPKQSAIPYLGRTVV